MTEETIFVETSVFLKFFIEGRDVFEKIKKSELYTSLNVIEEICYILLKEEAQKILKEKRYYVLLQKLRKNQDLVKELSKGIIKDIENLLDTFEYKSYFPSSKGSNVRDN